MTAASSLLILLQRAHANMDRLGYPPAGGRSRWVNPRMGHRAKLTPEQRQQVYRLKSMSGVRNVDLAVQFGVSQSCITRTVARQAAAVEAGYPSRLLRAYEGESR